MKLVFKNEGGVDKVVNADGDVLFTVAAGNGARAVKMQERVWTLQGKAKYTAAARESAKVEQLPGYQAQGAWAELGK